MVKAQKWTLVRVFDEEVRPSDFKLEEEELSETLQEGEVLVEALYLSVDPYMRLFEVTPEGEIPLREGMTMPGEQVAKVLVSRSARYAEGSLVVAMAGWRTHSVLHESFWGLRPCPPTGSLPPSAALGVLGMPGATAYFGLLEVCQPKLGETVLVNGAAGAVGSAVGQIAKIKGCKVIGFAGTKEKCDWLTELGFDHAFNYREMDVDEALSKAAPDGIDCYFDNVGGEFTNKVFHHMKQFGRVAICGAISTYSNPQAPIPSPFMLILGKQLRVEGFIVTRWSGRWDEAFSEILPGLEQGKFFYRETVKEGFENMPETFLSLFKGGNIGKMILKA